MGTCMVLKTNNMKLFVLADSFAIYFKIACAFVETQVCTKVWNSIYCIIKSISWKVHPSFLRAKICVQEMYTNVKELYQKIDYIV